VRQTVCACVCVCVCVCGSHRHIEQHDNEHIDLVQQRVKGQTFMY